MNVYFYKYRNTLYARLNYSERFIISTGLPANNWLPKKQQFSRTDRYYTQKNKIVNNIRTELEGLYYDAYEKGELNNDYFKKYFSLSQKNKGNIFDYLEEFKRDSNSTYETLEHFSVLMNHIKGFRNSLKFSQCNDVFMQDFERHFNKTHNNNTTHATMKRLRWFLSWAEKKGYPVDATYKNYQIRSRNVKHSFYYLTEDELMKIYNCDLEDRLIKYRDGFILMCFTGMRHSDLYNYSIDQVQGNNIVITTIKNHKAVSIPLNNISKQIIEKYRKVDRPFMMTNQRYNEALKEIGKAAGIDSPFIKVDYKGKERTETTYKKWQLLSTHCGKRTYITYLVNSGVPMEVISKITGNNLRTLQPYYDIINTTIKREVEKKLNKINLSA